MCLLALYCEWLYASCFDPYLEHHQANSIKYKRSYLSLVALIWIHIMEFL
jgi:hypothetical protein